LSQEPLFPHRPLAVVAFGGNALLRPEDEGYQNKQIERAEEAARWLVQTARAGYDLAIVHGNGPQVGNLLIQVEESVTKIPPSTLDVCVAQTEGSIGYMLEMALRNELHTAGLDREVATVVTLVEVDPNDPGFQNPTKPIGPFYSAYRSRALMDEQGWSMVEDSGRGFRKVVASPKPLRIVQLKTIRDLLLSGVITITAGGGGIPVVRNSSGRLVGVEAVIDKDYASALLAAELKAELFVVLTGVPQVMKNFGKKNQEALPRLTVREARKLLSAGQFPPGSMGPKIDSAIQFVERGGKEVLITSAEALNDAIAGRTGTYISA